MKATAEKKKTAVTKAPPAKRSSKTKTKGALKAGGANGYLFKMWHKHHHLLFAEPRVYAL
jgi:hypothetical protein